MFLFIQCFCVVCTHWIQVLIAFLFPSSLSKKYGYRKSGTDKRIFYRQQPKPEWARKEIIRLKALMQDVGK